MPELTTLEKLAKQVTLGTGNGRIIVAIAGPPGSGKSTFSDALCSRINNDQPGMCEILPMDGYHYDDTYLELQGWQHRKGAPYTFDVGGFSTMLARLKANTEPQISIPVFDRELEIARAGARMIEQQVSVLIVEGNYLFLDEELWSGLLPYFDITVMLEVPIETLTARLRSRWAGLGYSEAKAESKIAHNDLLNAKEVAEKSIPADYVVKTEG